MAALKAKATPFVPPVRPDEDYHDPSVCDENYPALLKTLNVKAAKGQLTHVLAQLKKCRNARDKEFNKYTKRDYNHVQTVELMDRLITLLEKELPIKDGTEFHMTFKILTLMPSIAPDKSEIFFEPQIFTVTVGGVTYHTFPVFFLYHGQGTFSVYNPYSHRNMPKGYALPEWVTPSYMPSKHGVNRSRTPSPPPHVTRTSPSRNTTRKQSPTKSPKSPNKPRKSASNA